MATEKLKISAYVPKEVFSAFQAFCDSEKVSMSRAVEVILREYFAIEPEVNQSSSPLLDRVAAIEAKLEELLGGGLAGSSLIAPASELPDSSPLSVEPERASQVLLDESFSTDWDKFTGKEVAESIGISATSLSTAKKKFGEDSDGFAAWIAERDPLNRSWRVEGKKYYAKSAPSNEQEGC
jgi:hypothetical protein